MRMMHNHTVDRARKTQRELLVEEVEERWRDDQYTVESGDGDRTRRRPEKNSKMRLRGSPFPAHAAVLLHDVEGYRVREVADLQQISLPAAKQRLRRGRMALVTALWPTARTVERSPRGSR